MAEGLEKQREAILEQVQLGLHRSEEHAKSFRKWDLWLLLISILLGTLATALAGGTAATGGSTADLFGGWRLVCLVVAVFTAVGTVASALHKSMRVTHRLTDAVTCTAKLQSLKLAITVTDIAPKEAAETYRRILEEHAECLT